MLMRKAIPLRGEREEPRVFRGVGSRAPYGSGGFDLVLPLINPTERARCEGGLETVRRPPGFVEHGRCGMRGMPRNKGASEMEGAP